MSDLGGEGVWGREWGERFGKGEVSDLGKGVG